MLDLADKDFKKEETTSEGLNSNSQKNFTAIAMPGVELDDVSVFGDKASSSFLLVVPTEGAGANGRESSFSCVVTADLEWGRIACSAMMNEYYTSIATVGEDGISP